MLSGREFLFLKLMETETPGDGVCYSRFNLFSLLNQGNDLYRVLQGLRQLGQLAISAP